MNAEKLVEYLEKKITKPLTHVVTIYDVHGLGLDLTFIMEPVAVEDDVAQFLVTRKARKDRNIGVRTYGDVAIPIRDGDTLASIMHMAIAEAAYGEQSLEREPAFMERKHVLHVAFEGLVSRREEMQLASPRP